MPPVAGGASATGAPPLDPAFGPASDVPILPPGTPLEIVKLDPDGAEVVRYPGTVLGLVDGWVVTEARWVNRTVQVGELPFQQGDRLIEWFSPSRPFNCFTVVDPESGRVRGWYANVTYPARFVPDATPPRIVWHDLFLDVVCTLDGRPALHDEDELDASGLSASHPDLHAAIVETAARVMRLATARALPFIASGWPERPGPGGPADR